MDDQEDGADLRFTGDGIHRGMLQRLGWLEQRIDELEAREAARGLLWTYGGFALVIGAVVWALFIRR
jgi:hypothetical protein